MFVCELYVSYFDSYCNRLFLRFPGFSAAVPRDPIVSHSLPPLNQRYSLLRKLRSLETVTKITGRRVLNVSDSFGSACDMHVYLCGKFLGSCVEFGKLIGGF